MSLKSYVLSRKDYCCWDWDSIAFGERNLERVAFSVIESSYKRICMFTMPATTVRDVPKDSEVERNSLKVWRPRQGYGVPKRANKRQERCLAGAILTHKQRQGREAGGLLLAEAAEVFEGDAVHDWILAIASGAYKACADGYWP